MWPQFFMWSHVTIWLNRLESTTLVTTLPSLFVGNRPCGSGDRTFLIWHVKIKFHVTNIYMSLWVGASHPTKVARFRCFVIKVFLFDERAVRLTCSVNWLTSFVKWLLLGKWAVSVVHVYTSSELFLRTLLGELRVPHCHCWEISVFLSTFLQNWDKKLL